MNHFWFANRLYRVIFFTSGLPCENETKTYISSDKEREEFRMRKFKKALAFALASAMIVSAAPVSAATTNSAKGTKSTIYTYTVDKSKKADANNKRSWIKVTAKKGYTYKLVNKTTDIVSLTKTRVEAKKAGTAKINVNFYKNGKYVETKSVKITVKKAPMIGKVTLDKNEITVGETTKVSNAGKGTAYFYSSNKDVATVDKTTGEITAKAAGTTTISAVNTITKARVYLTLTVNAQLAAKQTGVKEITLTGTNFTKDTAVTVKRGNTAVSIDTANVSASSDGKTLILPTKNIITAGEYTVTVGDKTVNFTGETNKITTIDVSDVAVVDKDVTLPIATNATASGATITYRVLNQFGEDITKTTSVQASASRTVIQSASQGTMKVRLNAYDKANDTISVVFMNTDAALTVTKDVKISAAAAANEVTVKGIYNENNKTLTEDTMDGNNDFYLLLDVVDQYGKNMASSKFTVGTTMESDLIVSAIPGATNVTLDTAKATVKTVDGHDYVAVPLTFANVPTEGKAKASAGTVSLVMMTKLGKTITGSFDVVAGKKVATFTASPSDTVVAGKETVFDFTATDTYGNDISNEVTADMFSASTTLFTKNTTTGYFKFAKSTTTGKNQLVFVAPSTVSADTTFVGSFITATNQIVNVQFTIKTSANPTSLGTASNLGIIAKTDRTATVKSTDVSVSDQYGTDYTFNTFSANGTGYELNVVKVSTTGHVSVSTSGKTATFTVNDETAATETFAYVITKDGKEIAREEFTVSTKALKNVVTSASDVTITEMPSMYSESERSLTVKAKINGASVTLKAGDDYTVVTNNNGVETNKVSGGAITIANGQTEAKGTYTVIIKNDAATEITKDITVSNVAPKAASATVNDKGVVNTAKVDVAAVLGKLTVKDQYGDSTFNDTLDASTVRVTFSDYSTTAANTLKSNGTANAEITLEEGDTVTAKVTFVGGFTFTTTIGYTAPTK